MGRKDLTFKQLERRRRLLRWAGIRGSTLRDWLPILIAAAIPILIFLGTRAITLQQADLENQRAVAEAERAEQSAQDEALQAYLDQMSNLMLEKHLRTSDQDSEVRTLARARTLTVLGRMDPSRKTQVMQFLLEAKLVQRVEGGRGPIIPLADANLSRAYLIAAFLRGADLSEANLSKAALQGANLSECDLFEATLTDATLQSADLSSADLQRANLSHAALQGANLSAATIPGFPGLKTPTNLTSANLRHAALQSADLSSATLTAADLSHADLSNTDLSHAKGWTEKQLGATKSLKGATMPNGQKYEDWLKSKKGQGKDVGNE